MGFHLSSLLFLTLFALALALPPAYPSRVPPGPSLPVAYAETSPQLNNHGATNTTNPPTFTAVPLDFSNSTIVGAVKSGIAAGHKHRGRNCTASSQDAQGSRNLPPGPHTTHASSTPAQGSSTVLSSAVPSAAAPASEGREAIGRRSPQVDGGSTQIHPQLDSPAALQGIGMTDPAVAQAYALGMKMGMYCTPSLPGLNATLAAGTGKSVEVSKSANHSMPKNDAYAILPSSTNPEGMSPRQGESSGSAALRGLVNLSSDTEHSKAKRRSRGATEKGLEQGIDIVKRHGHHNCDDPSKPCTKRSSAVSCRPPTSLSWFYLLCFGVFIFPALHGNLAAAEPALAKPGASGSANLASETNAQNPVRTSHHDSSIDKYDGGSTNQAPLLLNDCRFVPMYDPGGYDQGEDGLPPQARLKAARAKRHNIEHAQANSNCGGRFECQGSRWKKRLAAIRSIHGGSKGSNNSKRDAKLETRRGNVPSAGTTIRPPSSTWVCVLIGFLILPYLFGTVSASPIEDLMPSPTTAPHTDSEGHQLLKAREQNVWDQLGDAVLAKFHLGARSKPATNTKNHEDTAPPKTKVKSQATSTPPPTHQVLESQKDQFRNHGDALLDGPDPSPSPHPNHPTKAAKRNGIPISVHKPTSTCTEKRKATPHAPPPQAKAAASPALTPSADILYGDYRHPGHKLPSRVMPRHQNNAVEKSAAPPRVSLSTSIAVALSLLIPLFPSLLVGSSLLLLGTTLLPLAHATLAQIHNQGW